MVVPSICLSLAELTKTDHLVIDLYHRVEMRIAVKHQNSHHFGVISEVLIKSGLQLYTSTIFPLQFPLRTPVLLLK